MENMFSLLKISLVVVHGKESLLLFFRMLTVSIGEKNKKKTMRGKRGTGSEVIVGRLRKRFWWR
jgi:hypothetical protein